MNKLIDIYRLVDDVETLIYSVSNEDSTSYESIMDKDKATVNIVTEEPIYLQEGDYIYQDSVKYKINRDPEDKQKSDKEHSYTINFEAPIYTLIDKFYCSKINGDTTVTLTGKLRDFLELLLWNINKDNNPLGVDTGWTIGLCPDTDYMNITFTAVKCRDVLDTIASKFGLEYYVNNKTVNYISHIENETGLIFTQGKGGGLYEVERKNVDDGDLVTRLYAKGGTDNIIPGEGDSEGRLVLPEKYIENFSESTRGVDAIVEFDNIHPTFQGAVGVVSGDYSREFICAEIDFDIAELAIDEDARVNFLTGDLMGKSFEFKWDNTAKKITLIYQEDTLAAIDPNTGTRPNIPSASKCLRGGELFNLTGLKMSGTYKTNAIVKLRQKATEWLAYYCRKRVKFELNVDYRYLRENSITLHCGDLITINVPLHNISKLIRITSIEKNLYTGKLTCIVSNYLDEKWKDKIETEVANIKSSTTTVNGGYGGASSVTIIENNDEREASDSNVFSSLRALKEIAERAISKTEADAAQKVITFLEGLNAEQIAKLNKGATFGQFVNSMTNGKGACIDENGKAQFESVEVRTYFKALEIIANRLSAMEGDYSFTELGTIDAIENLGDETYRLTLRKRWDADFTAFGENNIVYGVFNSVAAGTGTEVYTSWGRILSVNTNDNTITTLLYPDTEVPGGKNFPFVKGMNITRKGDSNSPLDGSRNPDQDSWLLSSTEGRIMFLEKVFKPILEQYNYALSIGRLPDLDIFKSLPVNKDDMCVYSKNIIAQNYYKVDANGIVSTNEVFRGEWSALVASAATPYRRIVNEVTSGNGTQINVLEIHTVYHLGCKWACLVDKTTDEPKWNSPGWQFLQGDNNYSIDFESTSGWSFFYGKVDTTVKAKIYFGNIDITDEVMALPTTSVQWTRDTGNVPNDNAWLPVYPDSSKKNIVKFIQEDMGPDWLTKLTAKFTFSIFIPQGEQSLPLSSMISFNL